MQTITIHTTQNIDIDYEIAGIGERILALLIDYAIFFALYIIGVVLAINAGVGTVLYGYMIIVVAVFAFYDLVCETFLNGQSIGKRVLKIKVISLNGNRPTFGQYLLRWVLRLVDLPLTAYLGGLVSVIITEKGQRIGDLAAGTAMVRTHARTKIDNLVFRPSDDAYVPVFKEVSQLTDNDINLIADVLHNYMRTRNSMVVYNMARRIMDHLQVSLPPGMNDLQFLDTIIKDYSHIASQADVV